MNKVIYVVAGLAIAVSGGLYYANLKVENELNASIKKANESSYGTKVEGDVSTNIVLGTLKIDNMKIKSGEVTQEGNLAITGLKFYNKENVFSDKVEITLNDYKSTADQKYTSNNSFGISKSGEGKINLQATSAFLGSETQGNISQEYNANISGVGDLYETLTKDLSRSLVHNTPPENPMAYIGKVSGAKLDTLTLKVNNDRFLKSTLMESAKSQDPSMNDGELLKRMNEYVEAQIKQNVPETGGAQAKVLDFYKTDKSTLVVNFTNKTNKPLIDAYTAMLSSGNTATVIAENYDIKIDLVK
jgi:hypothetical protein